MTDCLFCKIVAGELPATKVAEDDRTLAFMDINPGTYGHLLVVPKVHSADLIEIGPEDLAACMATAQQLTRRVQSELDADGVNLLKCCGSAAWQTVFHFHLHVVPRYAEGPHQDRLELPWVPAPGDPEEIAEAARSLTGGAG